MAFIYQLLVAYCLLIPAIQGIQKRNDFSGLKELLRPRRETCDETQYYDHVTKNCDECAPQCDRHSQSPPTACEQFCKHRTKGKDLPKPTCDTGTYHDEITGNCDPCGPHCDRIPLDVPPPPCRNYCRDSEKSQVLLRPRRETCGEGQYLDSVTNHCDECAPHCDRPLTAPPTACEQFCKERVSYRSRTRRKDLPKTTCDTGTYHDEITGNCDPCGPHCDRVPLDDPPLPCRNYCRDSETSQGDKHFPGSETTKLPDWAKAVIAPLVLVVMVAVVGGAVLIRHRRQARQNVNLQNTGNEPINWPVEEDTIANERTEMVLNPSNK